MREFFPPNQKLPGVELSETEKLENYFVAINMLSREQRAMKLHQLGPENLQRMMGEEAMIPLVYQTVNMIGITQLAPVIMELSNLARARVMYCLNKKNEAVRSLSDIGSHGNRKHRSKAYYEMGEIFFLGGDLFKATDAFETALELGYDKGKVYLGLARIALAKQEIEEAEEYLMEAIANGDKLAKTLWAVMIFKQGEQDEAIGLLITAVREDRDMKALQTLEDLFKKSGRITELIEIYLEIVKGGDLTAAKKMSELGDLTSVPEDLIYDFSIEVGKVAVDKKSSEAFNVVGGALFEAYEKGHRKDEVLEILHGMIGLGNGNIANVLASMLYDKEHKIAEAIGYLEIALELGSTRALLNMAIIMRGIGDFTLAEKYFLEAMRSGDESIITKSVQGLMDLYVQFGRLEKVLGLNEIIGKVGKEIRKDVLPRMITEAIKNIVLIGKHTKQLERKSAIN